MILAMSRGNGEDFALHGFVYVAFLELKRVMHANCGAYAGFAFADAQEHFRVVLHQPLLDDLYRRSVGGVSRSLGKPMKRAFLVLFLQFVFESAAQVTLWIAGSDGSEFWLLPSRR